MENNQGINMGVGRDVWSGVKLFMVDAGVSACLGFAIGVLGAIFFGEEVVATLILSMMLLGIIVSMYFAFLLYRSFSQRWQSLVGLIGAGLISSVLSFNTSSVSDREQQMFFIAASIVAYLIGWYLAKNTNLKIFLLNRRVIKVFFVIGVIVQVVYVISFISSVV